MAESAAGQERQPVAAWQQRKRKLDGLRTARAEDKRKMAGAGRDGA